MKLEEAIFWINDTKYIYENMNPDVQLSRLKCEAFDLSVQALEKQIPKKVNFSSEYLCGNCNATINSEDCYCYNCGQRQDWGEDL